VPDRWVGLEAADMVVLHDFAHTALTPEQIAALRGYVASGGALLVPAGANWQRLAQSPLADLWPMTPSASEAASAREVGGIVSRYMANVKNLTGADRLGGSPVVVTRGALSPDALRLTGAKDAPRLLTARDNGAGRVLFLAMDPTTPPFLGWRGLSPLWVDLFSHTYQVRRLESIDRTAQPWGPPSTPYGGMSQATPAGGSDSVGQMLNIIRGRSQLQTPPTSVIAWFLALYVFFLVPVNYFVLRSLDKRELAWVTVPVIAVAFSIVSYAAARSIKGNGPAVFPAKPQARTTLLRGGDVATFALAAGGILHGVALVENDYSVEIGAQPFEDLLDARKLLAAVVGP
jgi:hypothetical protein